jgi:hypothetical protein
MRTHKEAIYVRKPGDKFRPLVIHRPTLKRVGAKLGRARRLIRAEKKLLKAGQVETGRLEMLRNHEKAILDYLSKVGSVPSVTPQIDRLLNDLCPEKKDRDSLLGWMRRQLRRGFRKTAATCAS